MEKVIVDKPSQWLTAQQNRKSNASIAPVYVNEMVVMEFVRWSIQRAKLIGFAYGIGTSVFIVMFVKLMGK